MDLEALISLNRICFLVREHFVDSTRAISEGTGEKDTKKALEFRRKEVSVSWNRCYDFVFWWFMNLSLSKGTLLARIKKHSKGLYLTFMMEP